MYQTYFKQLLNRHQHIASNKDEMTSLKNEISSAINKYNTILRDIPYGSMTVDGKEIELKASNINKYLESSNRQIRELAYKKINTAFENEQHQLAELLNRIESYRFKIATLEQYSSILEKVAFEEQLDPDSADTVINIFHTYLSIIQTYYQHKIAFLDITKPHLYDLGIPITEYKPHYSLEQAITIIKEALKPLGDKYLQAMDILINEHHIAAIPNEQKHQSIIFSWDTCCFLNFHGDYDSLKNLIHELGHIINAYFSSKKQPFIYEDSTIFNGEIAALTNEVLLNRYLFQQAETKEQQLFYIDKNIGNFITYGFCQAMYTEFEKKIEQQIQNKQDIDAEWLNTTYQSLVKTYYGNQIQYDDIGKVEWTRLGHLYRWSYYPFRYGLGLLLANTVVSMLVDNHKIAIEDYYHYLESGCNDTPLNLLKLLKIDMTNKETLEYGLQLLQQEVNNFSEICTSYQKKHFS